MLTHLNDAMIGIWRIHKNRKWIRELDSPLLGSHICIDIDSLDTMDERNKKGHILKLGIGKAHINFSMNSFKVTFSNTPSLSKSIEIVCPKLETNKFNPRSFRGFC